MSASRFVSIGGANRFDAEGSRYVLEGVDVRRVMSVFCCTLGRTALGDGIISLPFWCTFGRATLIGGVLDCCFVSIGADKFSFKE